MSETRTSAPFPLGHGARHLKRAKSPACSEKIYFWATGGLRKLQEWPLRDVLALGRTAFFGIWGFQDGGATDAATLPFTFRGSGIPSGNACSASCDFAANIAEPRCRRPTASGKIAVRLACTPVAPAGCPYGPELMTMTLRSVTR